MEEKKIIKPISEKVFKEKAAILAEENHSRRMSSFIEKGIETAKANKNIHFIKVTTEYLPISGLNIPRYIEKLNVLRMSMTIPNEVVSTVPSVETLLTIK